MLSESVIVFCHVKETCACNPAAKRRSKVACKESYAAAPAILQHVGVDPLILREWPERLLYVARESRVGQRHARRVAVDILEQLVAESGLQTKGCC